MSFSSARNSSSSSTGIPHTAMSTTNLLTPCTCAFCDRFIWGIYKQAQHCTACHRYYHTECAKLAGDDCGSALAALMSAPAHVGDRRGNPLNVATAQGLPQSKKDQLVPDSTHIFNVTTYTSPTWCKVCSKFIWGLARQGSRCKRCGLDAHAKCVPLSASLPCLSLSGGTLQVLKLPLMVLDTEMAKKVTDRRTSDRSHQTAFRREGQFRLNQANHNPFMQNLARASLMILPLGDSQLSLDSIVPSSDDDDASAERVVAPVSTDFQQSAPPQNELTMSPSFVYEQDNASFALEVDDEINQRLAAAGLAPAVPRKDDASPPSSSAPSASDSSSPAKDSESWRQEVHILDDFIPQPSEHLLSDFEVTDKELGRGQFGVVKVAINKLTKERLAVKIVDKKRFWGRKPDSTRHLKREIAILSQLKHVGVIRLHAVFDERENLFMFMELVEGGDLLAYVERQGSIGEDEAKFLFHQLAVGVKYLHDRGVVHRDLKPENLLLSIEDNVKRIKIADFGFANIIGSKHFLKSVVGTPAYVAPEILHKNAHGYTKAADLWSIGVILYACLGGVFPFDENEPVEEQIVAGKFNFPDQFFSKVSDLAIDVCCNLLVVDPRQRFTIDDMLRHPWLQLADARPLVLPV